MKLRMSQKQKPFTYSIVMGVHAINLVTPFPYHLLCSIMVVGVHATMILLHGTMRYKHKSFFDYRNKSFIQTTPKRKPMDCLIYRVDI
jgi:uncharacterized protein YhhL (DUF1145 family)